MSFLREHALSVALDALVVVFCIAILRQRRPAGTAYAWLLVMLFLPYVGMPLYLMFGGRKFRKRARAKARLTRFDEDPVYPFGRVSKVDSIEWLEEGTSAYAAFMREIERAQSSIRIITFVIGNDGTGRPLLEALIRKARAGVEVRLLVDDLLRFHAPSDLLRALEREGGRVARFMPLFHIPFRGQDNLRNHRKMAIFDGRTAIVGGMNLADEYMGPAPDAERWRDLSMSLTGAVVHELDAIFRADWEFAAKETLSEAPAATHEGEIAVRVIPSGPDSISDPIYDALLSAVFRAERRLWVATPYFVPDDTLSRSLHIAAARGVDVRIAVPGRSNHLVADLVGDPFLRDLAQAGVRVYRFNKMLHAKTLLVDDDLAIVGSANFDMRSLFLNYEIALLFTGREQAAYLARWFEVTLRGAVEGVVPAGRLRASLGHVARLLSPLL